MRTLNANGTPFFQWIRQNDRWPGLIGLLAGSGFTAAIAGASLVLAQLPVLHRAGPLTLSIIIAIIIRQLFGYPAMLRRGLQFSSKSLLRLAIILFGLKLNFNAIFDKGWGLLLQAAGVILLSVGGTLWLAKRLKADLPLSLLLGIGTGICGAAAIAAVSPILKSRGEDTALGAGLIALAGTVFSLGYTLLQPIVPITPEQYGLWSGISLHEIAHAALAAGAGGPDALAAGLLAKLARVLLLVPVCFILLAVIQRKERIRSQSAGTDPHSKPHGKLPLPWFLLGFAAMSAYGTFTSGTSFALAAAAVEHASQATAFLLAMAMAGLGMQVDLSAVRTRALKPFAILILVSTLLSAVSLLAVVYL
ncbi:YeiH family protein [Paenibacillus sp. NPDC058071]|uniref:YeiH family protein n=1 Tax=Paenibacillus sp. NPDC058071 TaxID=3346326 RepID=UPI0036DBB2EA